MTLPTEFDASDAVQVFDDFASEFESASFSNVFQKSLDILHAGFQSNFDSAESPSGAWAPHARYTVQKYGPHPLLILSGAMLASVTQSGSEGSVEVVGDREIAVGTSLFYAGFQQFGTQRIPARRFLWLNSGCVVELVGVFADASFKLLVG